MGLLLESFVVVASILVAFGLDAWWEHRVEREREAASLRALEADFEQNVSRLSTLAATEESISRASRDLLVLAVEDRSAADEDSARRLLGQVLNSVRFEPLMGAYEAVVSSGGLSQIRDDSLRAALAQFASTLDVRYAERFSDEIYLDFFGDFTGQLGFAEAVLAESSGAPTAPGGAGALAALLANPRFREHLAMRHLTERDVARSYRALLEQAQEVLRLVKAHAGK
jgi:hypothetical protein